MLAIIDRTKTILECLGGMRDPARPRPVGILGWSLWWGILLLLIWVFAGQDSKFIYVDF